MKKILCIIASLLFIVSCGGEEPKSEKLVVWSFTDELRGFINDYYLVDHPELADKIEVTVVPTENYQQKLDPTLASGKGAPDLFAVEAQFAKKYINAGYFTDLNYLGDQLNDLYPYVVDIGTSQDGVLRAIPWQAAVGAFFYRRSLAQEYLGVSEPEEVQAKLDDFDKFIEFARLLKEESNGEKYMLSSWGDLLNPYWARRSQSWVDEDSNFVIDPIASDLMDTVKLMYSEKLLIPNKQWTEGWFAEMSNNNVFGYFLPTWGLHYVLKPNSENTDAGTTTAGDWGVIKGPVSYYWGGTWIGIYEKSTKKEMASDLLEYLTLNKEHLKKYALESGDFIANRAVVKEIENEFSDPFLAGQNNYALFAEAAPYVQGTEIQTGYDYDIQNALFFDSLEAYMNGEQTKEEALASFTAAVKNAFPELK